MDVFLTRQPIFDRTQQVYAYEFLYQKDDANTFSGKNPDKLASNAILNSFDLLGIQNLTGGKKAFVNLSGPLLRQGVATLFSRDLLTVEILEDIYPDEEIIESCKQLKENGYLLVFNDFVFREGYEPLAELADIVKIDFITSDNKEKIEIGKKLTNNRIKFLAEKIETKADFEHAKEWGCTYFQGFFFSIPEVLSVHDIQPLKFQYLRLIKEVNEKEIDFEHISDIVSKDVSLSYKILKLINSAAFGFRNRITSVRQALVILGTREVRKWVSLIAFKGIGEGQTDELIQLSLVRAKFSETLSASSPYRDKAEELFLMGLFSSLDALMHRPMEEVLNDLPIPDEVRNALLTKDGLFGEFYKLILDYEKGDWDKVTKYGEHMGLECKNISKSYLDAVAWSVKLEKGATS